MLLSPFEFIHTLVEISQLDRYATKEGQNFVALSRDTNGYRFQKETDPNFEMRLSHSEIFEALRHGRATIHYNYHSKTQTKLRLFIGDRTLADFSVEAVFFARLHESMIFRYEEHVASKNGKKPKTDELAKLLQEWWIGVQVEQNNSKRYDKMKISGVGPSPRTFRRNYKDYMSCGRDVRALLPRHHGPGNKALEVECRESYAIWLEFARMYASRTRPSKALLLRQVRGKIFLDNEQRAKDNRPLLLAPGRKRFESLIRKMDEFEVIAGRHGPDYARAFYKAKMGGFEIERPGERVEFDDWTADMSTALDSCGLLRCLPPEIQKLFEKRRLSITVVIDAATRYVLAVRFSLVANARTVVSALEMTMSDKTHISRLVGAKTDWIGCVRCETAYSDNGPAYIADITQDAFLLSRIDLSRPPAGQPWKRGFIESLFSTFSQDLMVGFDGRTFANVVAKGDYDPEKHVTLTMDEFAKLFILYVCDVYHNRPTARLNGSTPHNSWVEKTKIYPIRAVPSDDEKRHIFGIRDKRKISSAGVVVNCVPYNSDALQMLHRKMPRKTMVDIGYHRNNISALSVGYNGEWITVLNTIGLESTVTLDEWQTARQVLLRENNEKAQAGLAIMYAAIERIRQVGLSATARAGLSPMTPSDDDYRQLERQLFEGRAVFTALPSQVDLSEPKLPADPLRSGTVEPLPTKEDAMRVVEDGPQSEFEAEDEHDDKFKIKD